MSLATDGQRAEARRIGEDIEVLAAREIDGLALVPDRAAEWYDAVATSLLTPSHDLPFGGICVVEAGTPVEIKAARRHTSNGTRSTPGRWFFKGRGDGQHARLLDERGVYLLSVYDAVDTGRRLCASMVVPAAIVDEHCRGRWYDSGRHEGQVAKLAWPHLLDDDVVESGGGG